MSIYPECDSEWSSREYLDYYHDKKYISIGIVPSGEETEFFDETIIYLYGHSVNPGPLEKLYQINNSHFKY